MATTSTPTDLPWWRRATALEVLIRDAFPEPWVIELDFATLTCEPEDDHHARTATWRLRWRDRDLYLYLVVVPEATADRMIATRLLRGLVRWGRARLRRAPPTADEHLPPVLPIVARGERPPSAGTAAVVDLIAPTTPGLDWYVPRLRYVQLGPAPTDR